MKRWWADGEYEHEHGWVIEVDGRFAGWMQYEEETYEWFPSVALDISLTTSLHGAGYGRRALRLAIQHFVEKGHHRFDHRPERGERARHPQLYRSGLRAGRRDALLREESRGRVERRAAHGPRNRRVLRGRSGARSVHRASTAPCYPHVTHRVLQSDTRAPPVVPARSPAVSLAPPAHPHRTGAGGGCSARGAGRGARGQRRPQGTRQHQAGVRARREGGRRSCCWLTRAVASSTPAAADRFGSKIFRELAPGGGYARPVQARAEGRGHTALQGAAPRRKSRRSPSSAARSSSRASTT